MKILNEYTDEEKIKWFDKMYNNAREQLEYVEGQGCEPKDCTQHTWEAVIELMGLDVWERWNAAL